MNSSISSVFRDVWRRQYNPSLVNISRTAKDDPALVQRLGLINTIDVHKGCVNSICWNDKGNLILSGSDDQHLIITNGFTYKPEAKFFTSHKANIFSAKFLPCTNDQQIISCSGDGTVLHTDLNRQEATHNNVFNCHGGSTCYEIITVPDSPYTFMSCGEDGTVRWFDLREKTSCCESRCRDNILVCCQRGITALAVSPTASHQLAVGCADSTVRIYDRRYLSVTPGEHLLAQPFCTFVGPKLGEQRRYRITCLNYDNVGRDMLVSYSSDYLYLFNVQESTSTELKKPNQKVSPWDKLRAARAKKDRMSPPPVRRLRLRGDWSDTGPDARPERDLTASVGVGQARPQLQGNLMQRMTDVLSRMLNDPMTRAALSSSTEDALDAEDNNQGVLEAREGGSAGIQEATGGSVETDDGQEEVALSRAEDSSNSVTATSQTSSSEPATPQVEASTSSAGRDNNSVTSDLHSHLTALKNLRQGFINQHGAEPSVSFRYSEQSTSSSTISLRANNNGRDPAEDTEERNQEVEDATVTNQDNNVSSNSRSVGVASSSIDIDCPEDEPETHALRGSEEAEYGNNCLYEAEVRRKYTGHRNARTMIKEATFWGSDFVMSGSDCGHVFVWNRHTAELHMLLQADQHVVNCLQPHPTLPILATSGIDHDIKVWAPIREDCGFDVELADDLIKRNAIMLEETRDTITVPAAFMIRMLACLNQIRRGGLSRNRRFSIDEET